MDEYIQSSFVFIRDIVIKIAEGALNLEFYGFHASTFLLVMPLFFWLYESLYRS